MENRIFFSSHTLKQAPCSPQTYSACHHQRATTCHQTAWKLLQDLLSECFVCGIKHTGLMFTEVQRKKRKRTAAQTLCHCQMTIPTAQTRQCALAKWVHTRLQTSKQCICYAVDFLANLYIYFRSSIPARTRALIQFLGPTAGAPASQY